MVQQVLLQLGEAGTQVADLDAHGVAVQAASSSPPCVLGRLGRLARQPLEDVVGRAVHQHQLDARRVERVRDGLVLGRRLGDRRDHAERPPAGREAVELGRERLQRHRQAAVAQLVEQRPQVLAQLQVDDLGLLLAQPPRHGQRRGRRVVAHREDLQLLAQRPVDVVDHARQDAGTARRASPAKAAAASQQLLAQGGERALGHESVAIAWRPPSRKSTHSPPSFLLRGSTRRASTC